MNPVQPVADTMLHLIIWLPLVSIFCLLVGVAVRHYFKRILDSIDGR